MSIKPFLELFIIFVLASSVYPQQYQCPYMTMELGKSWHYISKDYPDTLISSIVDTARIKGNFYYCFAPYGPNPNWPRYWLRSTPNQIFTLNMQDTTEYLLFDFNAEPDESWEIPPDSSRWNLPFNQCDWGTKVTLISNSDTVVNVNRNFINCFLFAHFNSPCFDAGIGNTWFARDFGIVRFSQNTEGGVLDWELIVEKSDTTLIIGEYALIGNPCLTIPCIPGVVSAVKSNDTYFVLESEGIWFWNGNFSWDGYEPDNGDSVSVTGSITSRTDVYGKQYFTVDVLNFTNYSMVTGTNSSYKSDTFTFLLSQNYPNPFNNTTVIKYSIPKEGLVTIKIYDLLGKEAAILVNETKQAGNHEVTFYPGQLPSGVYLNKLSSGDFIQTKKMILLK